MQHIRAMLKATGKAAAVVPDNVLLFYNQKASPNPWTKEVWYYDYRTNIHHALKKKPLHFEDLVEFIPCYNPENAASARLPGMRRKTRKVVGASSVTKSWWRATKPVSTCSG